MAFKYRQDEFFRLVETIENQGGSFLDETHDPVYHNKLTGDQLMGHEIKHCGENALFEVAYEPGGAASAALGEMRLLKVCAFCDRIGAWPRHAEARAPGSDG
jgi:hypothetical protein